MADREFGHGRCGGSTDSTFSHGSVDGLTIRSVLFTDMVDSTAIAVELGREGADHLRRDHLALSERAVRDSGGRVVKNLGDGIMAVFGEVEDCLVAAASIQHFARSSGHDHLRIRAGVGAGPVTEESGDVFGEPVIVAARLCAAAAADQILVPANLARLPTPDGTSTTFRAAGSRSLKGLPGEFQTVELLWHEMAAASPRPLPGGFENDDAVLGREAELSWLEGVWARMMIEGRQLVRLEGDAGIGKSALCREFARAVHRRGGVVLHGQCTTRARPYSAWSEILSGPRASTDDALQMLLADNAVTVTDLPAEVAMLNLFDGVVAALQDLEQLAPVLVVIEDIHWADTDTMRLLRHVAERLTVERVTVVVSTRTQAPEEGAAERLVRDPFDSLPGHSCLELAGIDQGAAEMLVREALGARPAAPLLRRLVTDTAAVPLLLFHAARRLIDIGAIEVDATGTARLVDTAAATTWTEDEVISDRIAQLGIGAADVLGVASVLGTTFHVEELSDLLGQTPDEIDGVCQRAVASGLLRLSDGQDNAYAFRHGLVQEGAYASLDSERRGSIHHRLGLAYESDGRRSAAERAWHWLRACPPDGGRAAGHSLAAAVEATEMLAPDETVAWASSAISMLEADDAQRRCEAMLLLGEAQRQIGDPSYRSTLLEAAGVAIAHGWSRPLVQAALALCRGWSSRVGLVDAERIAVVEAALQAQNLTVAERGSLLATLAVELTYGDPLRRRHQLAIEAIATARQCGGDVLLRVLQRTHLALQTPDQLEFRLANLDEELDLASRSRDVTAATLALTDALIDSAQTADGVAVGQFVELLNSRARASRQPELLWNARFGAVWAALLRGDAGRAEELANEAFELGLACGEEDAFLFYGLQLINIRWHQGRLEELVPIVEQVVADTPGLPAAKSYLALAYAETGRVDELSGLVEEMRGSEFELPYDNAWIAGQTNWAEAVASIREKASAALLYERLLPWELQVSASGAECGGAVAHYLGLLASALSMPKQAALHFEAADAMHRRLRAPFHLARTHFAYAELLESEGRYASAVLRAETAQSLAAAYGCEGVRARAGSLLDRHPDHALELGSAGS